MSNFADSFEGVVLCTLITLIVAIIGLLGIMYQTQKDLINNVSSQKTSIVLNETYKVMAIIDTLLDSMFVPNISKFKEIDRLESMIEIRRWAYTYGSNDAINILSMIFGDIYNHDKLEDQIIDRVVLYPLLAAQVRYDLTGKIIPPDKWLEMRIIGFERDREKFKEANNGWVERLKLNQKLKMK